LTTSAEAGTICRHKMDSNGKWTTLNGEEMEQKRLMGRLGALWDRPLIHLLLWRFGIANGHTQTTQAERDCLARYAAGKMMLAEIGVYHGVTTCRLRRAMDPAGVLLAIDPYPKQRLGFSAQRIIARREVAKVKGGAVRWMRTTGAKAALELLASGSPRFDFVFIDGEHTREGVKEDWQGWSKLVAPGGIIALHDSRSTAPKDDNLGSVCFMRDVISQDPNFETIATVFTLTVLQRR
jgi:predicted O-methyltransferase YrrM